MCVCVRGGRGGGMWVSSSNLLTGGKCYCRALGPTLVQPVLNLLVQTVMIKLCTCILTNKWTYCLVMIILVRGTKRTTGFIM